MSMVAIGVSLAGAAIGAGGSYLSGKQTSKAQKRSDQANRQNVLDTNALNKEQFDRTHRNQFMFQDALVPYFQQYTNSFLNDGGSFNDQVAQRRSILDQMMPAITGSRDHIAGVFNGDNLSTRRDAAGIVGGERIAGAEAQQASVDQALREIISQISAENAGKGFVGGSSFGNNRLLAATIGARQSGANAMADARITNASDLQRIAETDLAQRSEFTGQLPGLVAGNIGIESLPAQSIYDKLGMATRPLSYFAGNPQFQYAGQPTVQPDAAAGTGGAIVRDLGSAMLNTGLTSYLANRNKPAGAAPAAPAVDPASLQFNKKLSDFSP